MMVPWVQRETFWAAAILKRSRPGWVARRDSAEERIEACSAKDVTTSV